MGNKIIRCRLSREGETIAEVNITETADGTEVHTDIMPAAYSSLLMDTPEKDRAIISTFSMLSEMDAWLQESFNADAAHGGEDSLAILSEVERTMRMMAEEFGLEYAKTFPQNNDITFKTVYG